MSKLLIRRTPGPYECPTANIFLTATVFATVDADNYTWLSRYKWRLDDTGGKQYAYRRYQDYGIVHTVKMHREIMECSDGMETHHKDLNGLNNTRANLENLTPLNHRIEHGKSR